MTGVAMTVGRRSGAAGRAQPRGDRRRAARLLRATATLRPSVPEVAARAGVSVRSVHNHFADVEALRAEVAQRQWRAVRATLDRRRRSTRRGARRPAGRVLRGGHAGAARRAALASHDSPTIAAQPRARSTALLRRQLERDVPGARRRRARRASTLVVELGRVEPAAHRAGLQRRARPARRSSHIDSHTRPKGTSMSGDPTQQGTVHRAHERARRGPGRDAQPA